MINHYKNNPVKIFTLLLFLIITSCGPFEKNQMGYPSSVIFNAEGGEKTIYGDISLGGFQVKIGSEEYPITYIDSITNTRVYQNEWINIRMPYDGIKKEFIIRAEPLSNNRHRELTIYGDSGYDYTTIKVIQRL